jgi:DNA-binding NarL/FixJ family response regulator
MTPEKIKKAVEEYPELFIKLKKLQKRLIQVSGRDYEQEMLVMQRLESVEQLIEVIHEALCGNGILTLREACILDHRLDGEELNQIAEFVYLSREGVRLDLNNAYKKIADAVNSLE